MLHRMRWTLPLLLGTLSCLAGCTFPKSFGLARKDRPDAEKHVAEDRLPASSSDAEAEPHKASLAETLRKPGEWLGFARRKPAATDQESAAGGSGEQTASKPLVYPNIVPEKYRKMDVAAAKKPGATDAAGSPSLVRPSRRPPPDPAPKPPQDEQQLAQMATQPAGETQPQQPRMQTQQPSVAQAPVDTTVRDLVASATRSWRVGASAPSAGTTAAGASSGVAPSTASAAAPGPATTGGPATQLTTDTHLKFTTPNLSARDPKGQSDAAAHKDLAKNVLRPAKSAAKTGGPFTAARTEPASEAPLVEVGSASGSATHWIAKKSPVPPSPETPVAPSSATAANDAVAPAAPAASAGSATSTVVANTFGSPVSPPRKPETPVPPSSPSQPSATIAAEPSRPAPPAPAAPTVTIPNHTQAVARAENAPAASAAAAESPRLAKTPSQASPKVTTQAVTPPAAREEEMLAPMIDAATYRARLVSAPREEQAPIPTASRPSETPPPGSWIAAYEQLKQRAEQNSPPRPPDGSATRSLSSEH